MSYISEADLTDGTVPAEKIEETRIENTAVELNVIDLERLSAESIQFKSRATLRLLIVVLVQAISKTNSPDQNGCRRLTILHRPFSVRDRLRYLWHCSVACIPQLLQSRRKWLQVGSCCRRDLHRQLCRKPVRVDIRPNRPEGRRFRRLPPHDPRRDTSSDRIQIRAAHCRSPIHGGRRRSYCHGLANVYE